MVYRSGRSDDSNLACLGFIGFWVCLGCLIAGEAKYTKTARGLEYTRANYLLVGCDTVVMPGVLFGAHKCKTTGASIINDTTTGASTQTPALFYTVQTARCIVGGFGNGNTCDRMASRYTSWKYGKSSSCEDCGIAPFAAPEAKIGRWKLQPMEKPQDNDDYIKPAFTMFAQTAMKPVRWNLPSFFTNSWFGSWSRFNDTTMLNGDRNAEFTYFAHNPLSATVIGGISELGAITPFTTESGFTLGPYLTGDMSMDTEEFITKLQSDAWNTLKIYRYGTLGGLIASCFCFFCYIWCEGSMPLLLFGIMTIVGAFFPWCLIVGIASWVNNPALGSAIGVPLVLCTICVPFCFCFRERIAEKVHEIQISVAGVNFDTKYKSSRNLNTFNAPTTSVVFGNNPMHGNTPTRSVAKAKDNGLVMASNPTSEPAFVQNSWIGTAASNNVHVPIPVPVATPSIPVATPYTGGQYAGPSYGQPAQQGFAL